MDKILFEYAEIWRKRLEKAEQIGMSAEDIRLFRFTYQTILADAETLSASQAV